MIIEWNKDVLNWKVIELNWMAMAILCRDSNKIATAILIVHNKWNAINCIFIMEEC